MLLSMTRRTLRQGRVGPGRAKSDDLALEAMRAGPGHEKSGPARGQCILIFVFFSSFLFFYFILFYPFFVDRGECKDGLTALYLHMFI